MMIKDIHTHKGAPQPEGVISVSPNGFNPEEGQLYSVGIHPWETKEGNLERMFPRLEEVAQHPQVVAIGECGYDALKGGPAFRQLQVFHQQIELSERIKKGVIIHDVKAHDIIVGLRKDLRATQPWVIHGFRGKPTVAEMLLKSGCWIGFGENFNPETLRYVLEKARNRILAETDESILSIEEIISRMSEEIGEDLTSQIIENTNSFFELEVYK